MYLGVQRVREHDDSESLTSYLYLHVGLFESQDLALLRDVAWVSQVAPGLLAREQQTGQPGGRRVLSYLEVSGPDPSHTNPLPAILDDLALRVARGERGPIECDGHGAVFVPGANVELEAAVEEFKRLRQELERFFASDGAAVPHRELTVQVERRDTETRFSWARESHERLQEAAPDWTPTALSIDNDVRQAFRSQHGSLYPHVLDIIRPEADVPELRSVRFVDDDGGVLWFSADTG